MQKNSSDKAAPSWFLALSCGKRAGISAIILENAVFAASGTAFALLCREIIDSAISGARSGIMTYAFFLGAVVVLQLFLRLFCNSLSERLRAKTEMELRGEALSALLSSELSEMKKYHSGELLNRMFSDIRICADGLIAIVPSAVNMLTQLICAAAVMIILEPYFSAAFILAGLAVFAVTRLMRSRLKSLHKTVQEKEGTVRAFFQETLEKTAVIKVFGAEERVEARNKANQLDHFRVRMKRRGYSIAANAGFSLIFQAGYVLALVWGAFGIFSGGMTYGTLTAVLQLVNQLQTPFAGLSGLIPQYYSAVASAERVMEMLSMAGEKKAEKTLRYEDFKELSVSGLSFSYGTGDVITRADFCLKKGSVTALTGISGGGKSTLFMLLLGAYRPKTGGIVFRSDSSAYSAGLESRSCIAYVPQGNCLFSGTVRENVSFFEEKPDDERIIAALRTACAEELITELRGGLDAVIGENGAGLSEGQAQRLAVARAIYSGAGILLLDEATSALDEETESRLLRNISELAGKTVLIVTHRPAALKICNKKLTLKDGVIE